MIILFLPKILTFFFLIGGLRAKRANTYQKKEGARGRGVADPPNCLHCFIY